MALARSSPWQGSVFAHIYPTSKLVNVLGEIHEYISRKADGERRSENVAVENEFAY